MGATEFIIVFGSIILPMLLGFYAIRRWFNMKERRMEIEATQAAEKAAQYAVQNKVLEDRVAVLEQLAIDSGAETAAQIEALRQLPERKESTN